MLWGGGLDRKSPLAPVQEYLYVYGGLGRVYDEWLYRFSSHTSRHHLRLEWTCLFPCLGETRVEGAALGVLPLPRKRFVEIPNHGSYGDQSGKGLVRNPPRIRSAETATPPGTGSTPWGAFGAHH